MPIFVSMDKSKTKDQAVNSKGGAIFKKILEDKLAIHEHLKKGGKFSDLKDDYNFATPLPINRKG
jgi:hypothetical protein